MWDSTGGQGWEKHDLLSCQAGANRCCPEQKTKAMILENWQMKHHQMGPEKARTNEIQLQAGAECRAQPSAVWGQQADQSSAQTHQGARHRKHASRGSHRGAVDISHPCPPDITGQSE